MIKPRETSEASVSRVDDDDYDQLRLSFETMGCLPPNVQVQPFPGVGLTLRRPPSNMPDFDFVAHDYAPLAPEARGKGQTQQPSPLSSSASLPSSRDRF